MWLWHSGIRLYTQLRSVQRVQHAAHWQPTLLLVIARMLGWHVVHELVSHTDSVAWHEQG
jgi:hypothetical protein